MNFNVVALVLVIEASSKTFFWCFLLLLQFFFKKFRQIDVHTMAILVMEFLSPGIQLRVNQKDVNFQLYHHLPKFEVPVVVNFKHIFELFGLYNTCFLIQKLLELIRLSSDGQFWRKSQNKKGGKFELRSWLCYYNCTQTSHFPQRGHCHFFCSGQIMHFSVSVGSLH